jgi:signal peptidase I
MDRVKNITKNIINILCVILFIILALVIYAKLRVTFSNDVHANYFGVRIFEVASGSMEPTLKINDVLLVKVNVDDLQKDDIIAYKSEDSIITHRIVMINDNDLIVKGDANNTVDAPIKKDQVIGKVVKVFPHLGIWKKILTEPKILILIFITLLLFDGALSYNGKDKKNNKEEVKEIKQKPKKEDIKVDVIQKEIKTKNNDDLLTKSKMLAKQNIDELLKQAEEKIEKEEEQVEEDTEYTIRLDLNEIQKNINKSVK